METMTSTGATTKNGAEPAKGAKKTAPRPKGAGNAKPAKAAKAPPPTKAQEIIEALRAASRDKDIDEDRLIAGFEEAMATAVRKVSKVREVMARFDKKTGELTAWTPYRIVEEKTKPPVPETPAAVDPDDVPLGQAAAPAPAPAAAALDPDKEIRLPWVEVLPEEVPALLTGELAGKSWAAFRSPGEPDERPITPDELQLGDELRLWRSTEGLGRIAAQSAKQVLYQKVREAERDNIYNEYVPKIGELITGTVKRFERGDMIVDLGRTEAAIPREHQSRAERYTQGERVRAVLVDVHRNPKGSQLILSRTAPELLIRLMEMEVPEIYDGTVVIRGCVRQPGDRAKVAVSSRERDVDPVGACVGMRGARVQAIMRELRGERIDIIQFSDDLITYAQNALSPAKITRVSAMPADEAELEVGADGEPIEPVPTLECIVEEDQLSLAIGKRGQNVRLAAALIGARIEIKSEQAVKAEVARALQRMLFASQRRAVAISEVPGLSAAAVEALGAAGIGTLGDLLDVTPETMGDLSLEKDAFEEALEAARAFEEEPYDEGGGEESSDESELETETEGETDVEGEMEASAEEDTSTETTESVEETAESEPAADAAEPELTETPEK
jgi:N utilization substance protein A